MNEIEKTPCETIVFNEDGTQTTKAKKQFETHDEAVEVCKQLNALPDRSYKVVTYKCPVCCKYHIGRNGKEITDKYRSKLTDRPKREISTHNAVDERFENAKFKIVGKIDLSKIPKK